MIIPAAVATFLCFPGITKRKSLKSGKEIVKRKYTIEINTVCPELSYIFYTVVHYNI